MAVFFAVFDRQVAAGNAPSSNSLESEKWESVKLLPAKTTAPTSKGGLETAYVVRLEAASLAEAQRGLGHFFPGRVSDTPVIVEETAFKES